MKANREFLVSSLWLISLCVLGFCQQYGVEESADELPEEFLPAYTTDISNRTPELSDLASSDLLDQIAQLTPSNSSKTEPTSEPEVVGTTSPEPSKEPELEQVDYAYRDLYNEVCMRACLKARFKVDYLQAQIDGKEEPATTYIELPMEAKASIGGECGDRIKPKSQLFQIQWGADNVLKMHFLKTRSGDSDNWLVDNIELTYDTGDITHFENAVNPGKQTVRVQEKSEFFESPMHSSYKCEADDSIDMTSTKGLDKAVLEIYEIQLQPFMKRETNGTFSEAEICEGDKIVKPTSNVASVAVGATLGCLILIVIIVYAVGRRMGSITDRTGYKAVE